MTAEQHRQRHLELHRAFDELMADYLNHHFGRRPSQISLMELMVWSHRQTTEPDELPRDDAGHPREEDAAVQIRERLQDEAEGRTRLPGRAR